MCSLLPKRDKLPVQMWGSVRLVTWRLQDLRGLWRVAWGGRLRLHPWYSNWRAILPTPNRWLSTPHGMFAHFISSLNDAATSPAFWTVPTRVYEYELMIEVNTTDVDRLRNTLKSIAFPARVGVHANISHAAITTGEMKLFAASVHSAASVPFRRISFFFPSLQIRRRHCPMPMWGWPLVAVWQVCHVREMWQRHNHMRVHSRIPHWWTTLQVNTPSEWVSLHFLKCLTNYLIAMTSCITSNFVFFCFFFPQRFFHMSVAYR